MGARDSADSQTLLLRQIGDVMIKVDPALWEALEGIARQERTTPEALCGLVRDRLRRRGDAGDISAALVQALPVLVQSYRRHAAAESDRCRRAALDAIATPTQRQERDLSG